MYKVLILGASILAFSASAKSAKAETYLELGGGLPVFWTSTSNSDELEGGSNWPPSLDNWRIDLELGQRYDLSPERLSARVGVNFVYQQNYVHGRNGAGCDRDDCSADDLDNNELQAPMLFLNGWLDYEVSKRVTLYAGGGFGGGYFSALSDSAITPLVQAGLGARFSFLEHWSMNVGPRLIFSPTTFNLDSQRVDYFTITPLHLAISYHFGDVE